MLTLTVPVAATPAEADARRARGLLRAYEHDSAKTGVFRVTASLPDGSFRAERAITGAAESEALPFPCAAPLALDAALRDWVGSLPIRLYTRADEVRIYCRAPSGEQALAVVRDLVRTAPLEALREGRRMTVDAMPDRLGFVCHECGGPVGVDYFEGYWQDRPTCDGCFFP